GSPGAIRPARYAAGRFRHTSTGTRAPLEGESRELRAAQLARLGPRTGDLVCDKKIRHRSISTAEAARFGAAVLAIDADPDACARTTASARRFGVRVQVVHGSAPHILEDLPEPDVVRVGGGGEPVLSAVADRRPAAIVTHAGTRDEAELLGRTLAEHGYAVECVLLQSVALDVGEWAETERTVVFLLSAHRPDRAP
ncbi:methyltransferase, partial [Streptomyces sp. SPB074]